MAATAITKNIRRVWYFSFGANLSQSTLKRRGISPTNSLPGRVPSHKLSFTNRGYEGVEPRFADIEIITNNDPCVHGMAHEISEKEMLLLDKFEGEGIAYKRIKVLFEEYNTNKESNTSNGDDKLSISIEPKTFEVFAYTSLPEHKLLQGNPSTRYMKLLIDASKNKLDPTYCKNILGKIQCFDCKGMQMPALSSPPQSFTRKELYQHVYSESSTSSSLSPTAPPTAHVWVSIGGQIYDVSKNVHEREMLQHMATSSGGTKFALSLWRSAYNSNSANVDNIDDSAVEENIGMVDTLRQEEREYVAAWACHLAANYPFVGIVDEKHGENGSSSGGGISDGTLDGNNPIALEDRKKSKRSRNTTKNGERVEKNRINKKCKKESKKKGGNWVTTMYHLSLGVLRPCTLPLRVRILKENYEWWTASEEALLKELSAGIIANGASMFDNVTEETMAGSTIPLSTLSYNSKVQLSDDAFDGTSASLIINHDTGQCQKNMMLPCVMTCNVSPIIL